MSESAPTSSGIDRPYEHRPAYRACVSNQCNGRGARRLQKAWRCSSTSIVIACPAYQCRPVAIWRSATLIGFRTALQTWRPRRWSTAALSPLRSATAAAEKALCWCGSTAVQEKSAYQPAQAPARRCVQLDTADSGEPDPSRAILDAALWVNTKDSIVAVRLRLKAALWGSADMRQIRTAPSPAFTVASARRDADPVEHRQQIKVSGGSTLNEAHSGYTAQCDDFKDTTEQLFAKALDLGAGHGYQQIPKA